MMSDLILTEEESERVGQAARLSMYLYMSGGQKPCFFLFTEDTSWNLPLWVCGCELPRFTIAIPSDA